LGKVKKQFAFYNGNARTKQTVFSIEKEKDLCFEGCGDNVKGRLGKRGLEKMLDTKSEQK
jgi:hypothetical protein